MSDWGRSELKKRIVENLYADLGRSIPRQEISRFINAWAGSSNDSRLESLSIQASIADEFGVELSSWQKENLSKSRKYAGKVVAVYMSELNERKKENPPSPQRAPNSWTAWRARVSDKILAEYPDAPGDLIRNVVYHSDETTVERVNQEFDPLTARKIARAIYNRTQKALRGRYAGGWNTIRDTDTIRLYRGVNMTTPGIKAGDIIRYRGNSAESWTADATVAKEFGNIMLVAEVPKSKVYSTARTGVGCIIEGEVVLLGMNDVLVGVAYASPTSR